MLWDIFAKLQELVLMQDTSEFFVVFRHINVSLKIIEARWVNRQSSEYVPRFCIAGHDGIGARHSPSLNI
jgi:hypothetical protein